MYSIFSKEGGCYSIRLHPIHATRSEVIVIIKVPCAHQLTTSYSMNHNMVYNGGKLNFSPLNETQLQGVKPKVFKEGF